MESRGTTFHHHGERLPPTLTDLVRVLAVGQTQTRDGTAVTVMWLEMYRGGFLVSTRVVIHGPHQPGPDQYPTLDMEVRDDQGRQYDVWATGGSGAGFDWRFEHRCAPPLDPAAQQLRVVVPRLVWLRAEGAGEEVEPGPWEFTIALGAP